MTRRLAAILAVASSALATGYYFGSPYWTLLRIRSAAEAGQGDRVASYVDFPALRESLRSQFQAALMKSMQDTTMKDNPFAGFGLVLGSSMMIAMVDSMVTRDSLVLMLKHGQTAEGGGQAKPAVLVASQADIAATKGPIFDRHYEGMDTFLVEVGDKATGKDMGAFVFDRRGWFDWKLTSIRVTGLLNWAGMQNFEASAMDKVPVPGSAGARSPMAEAEAGTSVLVEDGVVKVYFASNNFDLPSNANRALTDIARGVVGSKKAVISCYYDPDIDRARSVEVAKARAMAVFHALEANGVAGHSIKLNRPKSTAGSRDPAQGRRVDVRLH